MLQTIVLCTNINAIRDPMDKHLKQRFKPIILLELNKFLATIIYMGLNPLPKTEHYWNSNPNTGGIHPLITRHFSHSRWRDIYHYLHVFDENTEQRGSVVIERNGRVKPWRKVKPLADRFRKNSRDNWKPGTKARCVTEHFSVCSK